MKDITINIIHTDLLGLAGEHAMLSYKSTHIPNVGDEITIDDDPEEVHYYRVINRDFKFRNNNLYLVDIIVKDL